jgi:hypothetical protein
MLILTILSIAVISVLWAWWSYKNIGKVKEVGEVKKELATGKVIFQEESASGDSSSSAI